MVIPPLGNNNEGKIKKAPHLRELRAEHGLDLGTTKVLIR